MLKSLVQNGLKKEESLFGFAEADTIMGKIGVKVWIFKGNLMPGEKADQNIKLKSGKDEKGSRRPRRSRNVETTSDAK